MSSSRRVRKTENTSRRIQPETETRKHYPDQHVPNAQQGHPLPGVPPPVPPHRGDPLRKGSIAEGVFAYKIQEVEPSDKNMVLARNHGLQQRPESPQQCDNLDSENDHRNTSNGMKDRESYMYNRGAEIREIMDRVKKPFQTHEEAIGSRSHRGQKRGVQDPESRSRDLWRDKLNELEAKLRSYDMQNKKLSEELQLERAGVERIKRAANQMQSNMDNREMFLGEQLNDDTVKPDFDKLMSDVRTWSTLFSGGEGHTCNPADFGEYQRIAPMCTSFGELEEFFKSKKHAKMFVRGWTAYVMCTRLFRNLDATPAGTVGEDAWLGRALADNFGCLEHELWFTDRQVITYKSFNDWRAYTAELLGKVASIRTEKPAENKQRMIAGAISEVMQVVKVWLKSEAAEDVQVAEEGLKLIFNDAVELAQTLRRQRVLWSIRFPSVPGGAEFGPLKFDPVLMEDLNEEDEVDIEALKKCGVDLVVTPVLYKRGTMNGEFFDSEKAISQAKVVVAVKR